MSSPIITTTTTTTTTTMTSPPSLPANFTFAPSTLYILLADIGHESLFHWGYLLTSAPPPATRTPFLTPVTGTICTYDSPPRALRTPGDIRSPSTAEKHGIQYFPITRSAPGDGRWPERGK
ncbi:hypothetical protein BELL_0732g00070 [Botrytis elliptica]|uniref:Uncharacterized protein n=1 Tax=Botrytis elliptica TaxID=278938 RepID=A0A4Z1JAQ3_9HELO|nr:hypothetical protein BELL_0732g00070 [Botrytis elliptica]